MKPVALRMLAVTLALACLAGCVPRRRGEPAIPQPEMEMPAPALPTPSPTPAPTAALPARSTEQRLYGSAGLLAWPCVLYSVYLDEAGGAAWSEEEIARSQQNLALAVDWRHPNPLCRGGRPGHPDALCRHVYRRTVGR